MITSLKWAPTDGLFPGGECLCDGCSGRCQPVELKLWLDMYLHSVTSELAVYYEKMTTHTEMVEV